MFNALKKVFGNIVSGSAEDSKNLAKSRLHFVLVQDRTGLNNDEIANFKKELVSVIEKYFVIDENGFDINYRRDNDTTTLLINSPIVVRRQKHIKIEPKGAESTQTAAAV